MIFVSLSHWFFSVQSCVQELKYFFTNVTGFWVLRRPVSYFVFPKIDFIEPNTSAHTVLGDYFHR